MVRTLAARGCHVVLAARSADGLAAAARSVEAAGGRATWVAGDLGRTGEADRLARAALAAGGRIDVLVSCAGSVDPAPLAEISDGRLDEALSLNLAAPIRLARAVAPAMMARRAGRILLVSSTFAFVSAAGYTCYAAAKAGLVGVATSLAIELAPSGIQVNAVAPGHVRTAMIAGALAGPGGEERVARNTPAGRIAEPEEIANVIAYLALDAPSFLTGDVVTVDGGYTCR